MRVTPIANPLPGEHLAAVHPTMRPDVGTYWHRRLNLFTGRALSDTALTAEQAGRAGRLEPQRRQADPAAGGPARGVASARCREMKLRRWSLCVVRSLS